MHAPLSRSPLSLGLCDPLSPGLERPSLPILDNCESLLIGLQRERITWAHNDVMAPGPSHPPPSSPPPIKTKSSSAPNVLETNDLTFCNASCMHASVQTTVYSCGKQPSCSQWTEFTNKYNTPCTQRKPKYQRAPMSLVWT